MSLKNISGTPWHVGFGDKCKDSRRHKSKCIYYQNGYCSFRVQNCIGSSHCKCYENFKGKANKR